MSAEAYGLAKNLIKTSRSSHDYLSTACLHDLHENCRLTCKYCDTACSCPCHVETSER